MKKIYFCTLLLLFAIRPMQAVIHIDGTPEQREKIARWLSQSLETTVGIDAAGNLTIADGGNAAATRLRNMINDAATSVTLEVVEGASNVNLGGWVSSVPGDPTGPTTGRQKIDISDIEGLGNVLNPYGLTPDVVLIHEITEVYEGKKGGLRFDPAHVKGEQAETELMTAHGTSWVIRFHSEGGYVYRKIRKPDGSFVVARVRRGAASQDWEWFTEQVPCKFEPSKLTAIADPDPKVHILNYNYDLNHEYATAVDTANSRPTGVAYDAQQNLYVTENLLNGQDEIRVFNPKGELVNTIRNPELVDPEGIDIDPVTGEIFVAAKGKILRLNKTGNLMGSYGSPDPAFFPTDVSVWRNYPTEELYGDGTIYDIFVTDKASSQVYRFNVQGNMNTKNFVNVFGQGLLSAPEGIQVDEWWTVWVASTGNNRVYCFSPLGNPESFGKQPYFIEDPSKKIYDMAMIRGEGVYVLDGTPGQGKLVLYDFNAIPVKVYGMEIFQCPASLAFAFSTNVDNLVSAPDPSEGGGSPGFPTWIWLVLGILFLAIAVWLVRRRR